MKKIIVLVCVIGLSFASCGDQPKDKDTDPEVALENELKNKESDTSSEKIKDCDDFLDTFEKWTLDLIALMENHEGDPIGLATNTTYTNTMLKGVDFMQDWDTISVSCATNNSYEARMKAIQEHMKKRQEELGF